MGSTNVFEISREGSALILCPSGHIGSLRSGDLLAEMDSILEDVNFEDVDAAVIDFTDLDYFGSEFLEALLRLWNRVQAHGGRMAVCNLSPVGRDILSLSKFDTLWQVTESRDEALKTVKEA